MGDIYKFIGFVVVGVLALIVGVVMAVVHMDEAEMHRGYAAWVKQTGNEKQLSFDEWEALVRSTRKQDDANTIIFIPTGS
jgi:hypothetical protein